MTRIDFEVIVVDDGSTDGTKELLAALVPKFFDSNSFRIFSMPINQGYGASIKYGVQLSKYDICGIIDCDSTYRPRELFKLFDKLVAEDSHMVVGERIGSHYSGTFPKRILRFLLKSFVQYMVDREIPDINSGIRVFRKECVTSRPRLLSNRFSFTTSLTLKCMLSNLLTTYCPVGYDRREGKSKVRLVRDSVRTFGLVLSVAFFLNPLKVVYPIILFSLTFGIFLISGTYIFDFRPLQILITWSIVLGISITVLLGFIAQLLSMSIDD
jgi:glycosyltransferase involved in cell wall biosynthesis